MQPAARETTREPSPGAAESAVAAGSGESRAGLTATLYTRFMRTITAVQKDLRVTLTSLGRDIAQNPGGRSFWMFLGLSFLYGVIHALGPGHGKSVVFAYFLGRRGSVMRGMVMGHVMTFVHVLSAVVLVFALQWGFGAWGAGAGSHAFDEAGCVLQRVSYSLVLAIGVFMVCHALYELASGRLSARICCTAAPSVSAAPASPVSPVSTGRAGTPDSQKNSYGSLLSVSVLAGLVPCPGAALVLAFSLSLNIPATGIAAMFALALGMGLTTSLFGVLSMASRSTLVYVAGRGPRKLTVLYGLLSVTGAACIALVGGLMLASLSC
ncbi:nickel/cobalt efflux system [Desulfovibrio psychrotolerans]|uniref:Nickel/cobalt efflux system n=2 Tax=Desulfovibrio psychrotolerans TaxID=415242 RepID=A0A7J0BTC2_9BACT|nr:nickel/cobalt efflux system [Desulfovibrio psychrotolerans]